MLSTINAGDTAWMLISAALVFLMVCGLAFFYGSLTRNKNPLSILTSCLVVVCLITLQWLLFGYSLVFGPDHNGWIGTLAYAGLCGVGAEPNLMYAGTTPQLAFAIYHAMLALIGPVVLLGSLAERIRFRSFCVFVFLWSALVYDPVAHWLWSVGGFLRNSGAVDFAGGAVVHMTIGSTALAAALFVRKRGRSTSAASPADSVSMALGATLLWLGWLGANAGSALGAGGLAAGAFMATQASAAAAGFTWAVLDRLFRKKLTLVGPIYGVLAGLIAATPSAGYVGPGCAMGIGVAAAILGFFAVAALKAKFGDALAWDVFTLHGLGGFLGMLIVGSAATTAVNPNGVNGFFYGNTGQFAVQLKAALAVALYSFSMSFALLQAVHYVIGLHFKEPSGPSET